MTGQESPDASGRSNKRAVPPIPSVIWWITALHVSLLLAYSVLLPTYRAPDEPLHVDLAHVFSDELRYPAWDEGSTGAGIQKSLSLMRFGQRSAHLTAEQAVPKDERPSIEELEGDREPQGINQQSQHPPLYYALTGTTMRVIEGVVGDPVGSFALETWVYRLMGLLLVAPLPLIIWRIGSVLGVHSTVGVAAALVPLGIPQLTHIGSSVTNDTLAMLLFWALTPVVIRVADGALRPRTAALGGALTGLALFTKGFGTLMVPWMAVALGIALLRQGRAAWRAVATSGAVFLATSTVFGGWWWIRDLVLYGEFGPSRFDQLVRDHEGAGGFLTFLDTWGTQTTWRFWGDFGWYDTRLPGTVIVAATLVCVALIAVALASRHRMVASPLGNRVLLLMPLVLLVVSQFQVAYSEHQRTSLFPGLQGRYWFGAIAAMSPLIALGLGTLMRRRLRWVPVVVLGGVAAMQILAVSVLLGFYWGEPHSALADRLRAVVAWTPLPGELIGVGAIAAALIAATTVAQVALFSAHSPARQSPPDHQVGVASCDVERVGHV